MKNLSMLVVALLVAGATSSWVQAETDKILVGPVPITLKATLSDKTKVTETTLTTAAGGGTLQFATVQLIGGGSTGIPYSVIGTSIGLSNIVAGSVTDVYLVGKSLYSSDDAVSLSRAGSKTMKFISSWSETGLDLFTANAISNLNGAISNSVLLVTGTVSDSSKGTNLNAKAVGIWVAGKSAVTGTIKSEATKPKK